MIIHSFHLLRHNRANGWTGSKKEVCYIYFIVKGIIRNNIAILIDKTKRGNGMENGVSIFLDFRDSQYRQFCIGSRLASDRHRNNQDAEND